MSVRKRTWTTNGETKIGWICDLKDASGQRYKKQFATKSGALAHHTDLLKAVKDGTFRVTNNKLTVAEFSGQYLEYCAGRYKRGERFTRHHLICVQGYFRNYILAERSTDTHQYASAFHEGIGALRLRELTKKSVTAFRDRLRNAGVSVVTARKILSTVRTMFEYAVEQEAMGQNPARGVRIIGHRAETTVEKRTAPPHWLVRAVISEAGQSRRKDAAAKLRAGIVLAATSGIRASEMRGLRWTSIDYVKRELAIVTRVDAYGEEDGYTKSAAGRRVIPLGRETLEVLRAWMDLTKYNKETDFVFAGKTGGPACHDYLRDAQFYGLFDKLLAKHVSDPSLFPSEPFRFKWHELRHFAISTWIARDLPIKTIMTWAGHSSMQMTMDRYGHMFKTAQDWTAMDFLAKDLTGES